MPRRSLADRFWPKVTKGAGCWRWIAAIDTTGYGVMSDPERGKVYAHRISYELNVGPIPKDREMRHSCDNRWCVNPAHLSTGTRSDNMQDAVKRGRHVAPWHGVTHCKRGHEFTLANTRWTKDHRRACRTCAREHMREVPRRSCR